MLGWLGRHRGGLRRLAIDGRLGSPEDILACLAGAPLRELVLTNNAAVGADAGRVLRPLGSLSGSLTSLDLGSNRLRQLPAELSALRALGALSLSGNSVLWQGGEAGLRPLQHLTSLTRLALGSCRLKRLPQQLSALRGSLKELDLSFNAWPAGEAGRSALQPLAHLSLLTRLDLHSCGLESLPPQLSSLSVLRDLNLNSNAALVRGGASALAPLGHLQALTRLRMCGCWVSRLPPKLPALESLVDLNLSGNEALGKWGEGALLCLERAPNLTRLDISWCGLASIPPQVTGLPALAELDLRGQEGLGGPGGGGGALKELLRAPALVRVDLRGCRLLQAATAPVVEVLEARRVEVVL
jgi:hypothetical protein